MPSPNWPLEGLWERSSSISTEVTCGIRVPASLEFVIATADFQKLTSANAIEFTSTIAVHRHIAEFMPSRRLRSPQLRGVVSSDSRKPTARIPKVTTNESRHD